MLKAVEVKSLWQALVLRDYRNQCRQWATHYNKKIGIFQQLWWWFEKYTPRRESGRLYCYLFYLGDHVVGYGLASIKPDGVWISGGVGEHFRGFDMADHLFAELVNKWGHKRMYLDVFEKNKDALKIYKRLGFREIGRRYRESILVMRRSQKREGNHLSFKF